MARHTLTQADQGGTVDLAPGDELYIHLPENPTTGFRWALDALDSSRLEAEEPGFTPSGTGMGAGGERILKLRARASGTVRLRLKLWREWEGEASVTQRYDATVSIR